MHPGILGQQLCAQGQAAKSSRDCLPVAAGSLDASTGTCARGGWPTELSNLHATTAASKALAAHGRALAQHPERIEGTALGGTGTHGPQLPGLSPN
ncbi:hypothetical protein TrVGV298_004108 [Trichoderma virens]|nr:hypothetical protein TrVGV298_004108 [Trichoderma virens]